MKITIELTIESLVSREDLLESLDYVLHNTLQVEFVDDDYIKKGFKIKITDD